MTRLNLMKNSKLATLLILTMVLIAIFAPYIAPYDANDFSFDPLMPPSTAHLLGTNHLGQDIFSSLLMGFRISISIALASAFIATLWGTFLAVLCSFYKGKVEMIIVKITELFLILPEIIMIMIFATFAGPSIYNIIFVISFFSWCRVTRIIRSKTMVVMTYDTIQYSLLLKAGVFHILQKLWVHIYPSVATMFILQCSKAMMYEANLSFLGIGDPTIKSWGRMIRQAMEYEGIFNSYYLWWLIPPIVCIVIFIATLSNISFKIEEEVNNCAIKGSAVK